MSEIPVKELIQAAMEARKKAYAPYSGFWVGAAVLTADERIYTGCNVENASYGATNCAERTALYKAVSEGKTRCRAIAIAGSPKGDAVTQYAYPCGICRQVMREFAMNDEFTIIVAKSTEEYQSFTLEELLPESFSPNNLN